MPNEAGCFQVFAMNAGGSGAGGGIVFVLNTVNGFGWHADWGGGNRVGRLIPLTWALIRDGEEVEVSFAEATAQARRQAGG
jgi:hypothetical protein